MVTKRNDDASTRRRLLKAGLAAIGGGIVVASGARAQTKFAQPKAPQQKMAQDKIAQNLVQYQGTPKDGQKCSICVNFEAPNACKIVTGAVSPEGWCIAYAPKES